MTKSSPEFVSGVAFLHITIDRLFTFQITCDNMRKTKENENGAIYFDWTHYNCSYFADCLSSQEAKKVKILQQIRITKAIFSILKPILPMSFHVVEKKHPKA